MPPQTVSKTLAPAYARHYATDILACYDRYRRGLGDNGCARNYIPVHVGCDGLGMLTSKACHKLITGMYVDIPVALSKF